MKLFRKIRKTLLEQSKFQNYIRYAFGEIVLVVIGILIALQVNTWNENRKLGNTNEILKQKLIGELEMNIDRLHMLDSTVSGNNNIIGMHDRINNASQALDYLHEGLDSAKLVWILDSQLFLANSFNLHNSVYEEMKNTGRLYLIGSDSLLQSIDKYYKRIEREEFYNNQRNTRVFGQLENCRYGYQLLELDFEQFGMAALEHHSWVFDSRSNHYTDLKLFLNAAHGAMSANRLRMLQIVEDSDQLIAKIKSEMRAVRK